MFLPLLLGVGAALAQTPPVAPSRGGQTFPALSNPSISLNGLFVAGAELDDGVVVGRQPDPLPGKGETFGTGLAVQEFEVQFQAAVDPYFKANAVLAIPGVEGIEIEEGFATLTALPRILIDVGKQKESFGRENLLHTHAYLTIDKSLIGQRMFGEEGLNDMAIDAAVLLPLPWYSELTVGVDAGGNEVAFGSGEPLGLGTLAHWKNVVDLGSYSAVEIGASGLAGRNAFDGESVAGGADLTFKSHGKGRRQWDRLTWQSEVMFLQRDGADDAPRIGGLYSTLEVSPSKRVWLGGRFDQVGLFTDEAPTYGATLIGVFVPTEFSSVRLQAQRQFLPDGHTVDSLTSQLNFTIGAHPAHAY